ncbi:MAG: penicillin-binding transpeptidase domain-containing protein [bacterium]|nr:penicillin-binding transpeptidase domain-containing protein [bacterium]
MNKTEELNFEEILQDNDTDRRSLELSLTRNVFYGFYVVMIVIIMIFFVRTLTLSVVKSDFYTKRAFANVNKEVYIPAPRGIIYDRFNKVIAGNEPGFSVSIKLSEYRNNQTAIRDFLKASIGINNVDIDNAIRNANLEESDLVIVSSNIIEEDIIKLRAKDIKGLYIEDNYLRNYPFNDAFTHVVGYVDTENIGRTGLEAYYQTRLKGTDGAVVRQRDARGKIIDFKEIRNSSPGTNLNTTLDADFQIYFKNRLEQGLEDLNKISGVGVAVDPRTGEILALISLPSFDSNLFSYQNDVEMSKQKTEILNDKNKALFNRALSGVYNPGSTIKPLVAVAALTENVITPTKQIYSRGYIEVPNPYNPSAPSRFLDSKPNGWVDVRSALAKSSNIFFYAVGGGFPSGGGEGIGGENMVGLGINRLIKWWQKFGLGEKTNIDLLDEKSGFLPNPDEKKVRTGTIWRIGDTYNVSIGQGDLLITPLQLINYISAIANGGTLNQLYINKDIESVPLSTITGSESQFKETQEGMRDVVRMPYGSAKSLNLVSMSVAAKTGTAQIQNNQKLNAFTVAYAPYDNPQVVILVLIEDAREGSSNTIPVARDVLEWYYRNRIANQKFSASSTAPSVIDSSITINDSSSTVQNATGTR